MHKHIQNGLKELISDCELSHEYSIDIRSILELVRSSRVDCRMVRVVEENAKVVDVDN